MAATSSGGSAAATPARASRTHLLLHCSKCVVLSSLLCLQSFQLSSHLLPFGFDTLELRRCLGDRLIFLSICIGQSLFMFRRQGSNLVGLELLGFLQRLLLALFGRVDSVLQFGLGGWAGRGARIMRCVLRGDEPVGPQMGESWMGESSLAHPPPFRRLRPASLPSLPPQPPASPPPPSQPVSREGVSQGWLLCRPRLLLKLPLPWPPLQPPCLC